MRKAPHFALAGLAAVVAAVTIYDATRPDLQSPCQAAKGVVSDIRTADPSALLYAGPDKTYPVLISFTLTIDGLLGGRFADVAKPVPPKLAADLQQLRRALILPTESELVDPDSDVRQAMAAVEACA